MKNLWIFGLICLSNTLLAQLPKGEIWALSVDSVSIVREDLSTTTIVSPATDISYNTDENKLEVWESNYHNTFQCFEPDQIYESTPDEEPAYLMWWGNGKMNPGLISPSLRNIPDCRIGFNYYPESKRLVIIIRFTNKNKLNIYSTKIKEIKPSKPPGRKFNL
ncbi:hypothetical protein ES705_24543 [subsurface metagenome]